MKVMVTYEAMYRGAMRTHYVSIENHRKPQDVPFVVGMMPRYSISQLSWVLRGYLSPSRQVILDTDNPNVGNYIQHMKEYYPNRKYTITPLGVEVIDLYEKDVK